MKIGIDLSALQGPHRMRGIGSVLRNFINHLPREAKSKHTFIFFVLPKDYAEADPFNELVLDKVKYEVRELSPPKRYQKRLPGKLNLLASAANQFIKTRDLHLGDSRLSNSATGDLDVYLQIDPGEALPKHRRGLKRALFLHDLIPYILEWDYMWTYKTARHHGFSRKAALRVHVRRKLYTYRYKSIVREAELLLANSQCTKDDFVRYFSVNPNRITVTHLGVELPDKNIRSARPTIAYKDTSWGYLPDNYDFDIQTPFLLYAGGADHRRKLQDLVTAFNRLRAQGVKIKLVLAGDTMKGPMQIGTETIQQALKSSSYLEDIIFLGFTPPKNLTWLYQHALAFVFPSKYEGFGLPVLEALSHGTAVIAYDNAAVREVAGIVPTYVYDFAGIESAVLKLLNEMHNDERSQKAITQAGDFTWDTASAAIIKSLINPLL